MTASLKVFPYVLLRVAGEAHADLRQTDIPATWLAYKEMVRCQDKTRKLGKVIAEGLHACIPNIDDPAIRQLWLAVKRDTHNHRPLSSIPQAAYTVLPAALQKDIRAYRRLRNKCRSLEKAAEQHYATEVKTAKDRFAALLHSKNLQNGLVLSSATIGISLEKYLNAPPDASTAITKKERSFMEYLSRMHTKPSPFSSFTHLAAATFADSQDADSTNAPFLTLASFETNSHIQLNHDLYRYLSDLLLAQPEIRRQLPVKLNSTIKKIDGVYHFLVNHHNQEAVQHIPSTPALDILLTLAAQAPPSTSFRVLAAYATNRKYIKASPEEVETYLDQLVDLGFFEPDLGISGIDREWHKQLARRLTTWIDQLPQLEDVARSLTTVSELSARYAIAPTAERQRLLNQALRVFKSACQSIGATSPQPAKSAPEEEIANQAKTIFKRTRPSDFIFEAHKLWYEDTTLKARPTLSSAMLPDVEKLGDLLARVDQFDGCLAERENTIDFFKATYDTSKGVDLLQFYHEYGMHQKASEDQPHKSGQSKREQTNKRALDVFWRHLQPNNADDEIQFGQDSVSHLKPAARPTSFSAYFHAYKSDGDARLVLSATAEGYGKMFSRFVYLFNDDLAEKLRQPGRSHSTSTDSLLAEVTDASFFNANLHPRIMPYEIITPGGHTALPPAAQLHVTDLAVCYDETQEQLVLIHRPSKKRVVVFDLGFQDRGGRSKLYSLLCTFSPGPHHNVYALLRRINSSVKTKPSGVRVLPRVIYEKHIILQRKVWEVPKEKLPARKASETDWAYFLRVNQWRQELHIPDEVFVRAQSKPQYISFRNPFFIALFASHVKSCKQALQIEEMLPNGNQLAATNGRITEFLVQWDTP